MVDSDDPRWQKYLGVIQEDILDGLDEDIAARYVRRLEREEASHCITWQGFEPWLEQLCRNVKELTQAIASIDSYYRHGVSGKDE